MHSKEQLLKIHLQAVDEVALSFTVKFALVSHQLADQPAYY